MTKPGTDAAGIAKTEVDHIMRCKNPLSVALTPRDFGDVAVRGQPSDRDTPKAFS